LEISVPRFALILIACVVSTPAFAKSIRNVTVCAIACNSELEAQTDIDNGQAGTVYYAEYKADTKANPNTCMMQAKHLPTYEYKPTDQDGIEKRGCSEILLERFFGKKVDIEVSVGKNNLPVVTEITVR
jgi:hypothetical protein